MSAEGFGEAILLHFRTRHVDHTDADAPPHTDLFWCFLERRKTVTASAKVAVQTHFYDHLQSECVDRVSLVVLSWVHESKAVSEGYE